MPNRDDGSFGEPGRSAIPLYAYEGWDDDLAKEGQRIAARVRRRTKAFVIDTGRDLTTLKNKLEHGQFLPWVRGVLGLEPRTAQNYMSAAEAFSDKSEIVSHLPPTTIYKLARAPEPVRTAVLERMEAGNQLNSNDILEKVRVAREVDRKNREQEQEKKRFAILSPKEKAAEKARGRRTLARERDEEADREAMRSRNEAEDALLRKACANLVDVFGADRLAAFADRFRDLNNSIVNGARKAAQAEFAKLEPVTELAIRKFIPPFTDASSEEKKRVRALAEKIETNGVYDPLQVGQLDPERYEILDGRRRFVALVDVLGLTKIRVQIAP